MTRAQVAIAKDAGPAVMARTALDLAGIGELCRGKEVFIKANLSGGPYENKGAIVSEETTRAVLAYLKPLCRRLAIGDAARFSKEYTKELFEKNTWARALADELGVELVNLWESDLVDLPVPHPAARSHWTIPKGITEWEVVGSMAVMKVSAATTVTLAMKNFYGLLAFAKQYRMHTWAHEVVVDLTQLVKPAFGIIDGFWGWEANESSLGGKAINPNVVLIGRDVVALDAVGALVMGRDPRAIKKLALAQEVGLGVANPEEIEVLGVPIEKARIVFEDVPEEVKVRPRQSVLEAGIEALLVGA